MSLQSMSLQPGALQPKAEGIPDWLLETRQRLTESLERAKVILDDLGSPGTRQGAAVPEKASPLTGPMNTAAMVSDCRVMTLELNGLLLSIANRLHLP